MSTTATSHTAHRDHETSGKATANRKIVLAYVERFPNSTAVELWRAHKSEGGELTRHEFSRRLPELRRSELIVNGPSRECSINGTLMVTWLTPAYSNIA